MKARSMLRVIGGILIGVGITVEHIPIKVLAVLIGLVILVLSSDEFIP